MKLTARAGVPGGRGGSGNWRSTTTCQPVGIQPAVVGAETRLTGGGLCARLTITVRQFLQIALLFGLTAVLLDAGECGSVFFGSKEKRECCNQGKCAPSNRSDDCCNAANTSFSGGFIFSGKCSIPNPLIHVDGAVIAAVLSRVHPILTSSSLIRADHTWLGPPFAVVPFNSPLLI